MEILNSITRKTLLTKFILATLLVHSTLLMVAESYQTTKISVTNHLSNSSVDSPEIYCFNYMEQVVHKELAKNERYDFEVELKRNPQTTEIICVVGQVCRDYVIYRTSYDEWRSIEGKTSFYVTLKDSGTYRYEVKTKVWRKLKLSPC
ncbi:hypothetical protein RND81_08G205600 [Saponaria officinalis]|uniref:Uncharacterized protein n=1 Tax=Saponaria officinalis TaxID=3572 RepID=A0AAW1JAC2_SAPOF